MKKRTDKRMTERELFEACGLGYPTAEELYRFTNRLGELSGVEHPTKGQVKIAKAEVEEYRQQENA